MTCNRDKNSMKEEAANGGIPLHVGLCGGKFRKLLAIVTRTLYERAGCALRNTFACRALGGKFRK